MNGSATTVQKLWSAKGAAWWVLLINGLCITLMGAIYACVLRHKPPFADIVLGGNVDWEYVQRTVIWVMSAFRLIFYINFLLALWLTFWHHRMKKVR